MLQLSEAIVLAVVSLAILGCGGSGQRAAISGTVTVNGQALSAGNIAFVPLSPGQGVTAGAAIESGSYDIRAEQGLLPGEYRVQIHAFRGTGQKLWDGMGDERAPASQKRYAINRASIVATTRF